MLCVYIFEMQCNILAHILSINWANQAKNLSSFFYLDLELSSYSFSSLLYIYSTILWISRTDYFYFPVIYYLLSNLLSCLPGQTDVHGYEWIKTKVTVTRQSTLFQFKIWKIKRISWAFIVVHSFLLLSKSVFRGWASKKIAGVKDISSP